MASTPKIQLRDGSGFTSDLVLTTNQDSLFFNGTVDVSTADIQVSVNGGPFLSDPGLVKFDLPAFTVPNPSAFPSGLILDPGVNVILIRTIDIVGGVSAPAKITITKVRSADIQTPRIPTGVRVRRLRDAVDVMAARPAALFQNIPVNFRGFNFYASRDQGGTSGYFRINEDLVTETSSTIFDEFADNFAKDVVVWDAGNFTNLRIRVTEEDSFGREQLVHLDTTYPTGVLNHQIRFTQTLEDLVVQPFISFRHFRRGGPGIINEDQFADIIDTDPLFYVVTAVYFDPISNQEIESTYSQEVLGQPLIIDTSLRGIPLRDQSSIVLSYVAAIQQINQEISLIPGSTTRDVSIDPFASEAERLWFLVDFVHKAGSFLTLLAVDDANGDGVSDPVATSSYKTALKAALGLTSDVATQTVIDNAFDKLASNLGKSRLPGRPSIGQAVFYTTQTPTKDLPVPSGTVISSTADTDLGIPSVQFRVGGTFVLPAVDAQAFYNFDRKRYELVADITAVTIGADGNRPAGQITNAQGVSGLQVTNLEATVFGSDRESNSDLAQRCMLAYSSVDTGTEGGYASRAAGQTGIIKAKIVKSGDDLMMRDYDNVRGKHIGGKVDIWVEGLRERQISEKFAFTFEIAKDIRCEIIDLASLTFRVLDSRVTPSTPLIEILDNPATGLGVRNASSGLDYNLSGVTILDYQTFRINTSIPQPVTHIDDIILADYRFRSVNAFTFTFQPVRRVISVVGEVSGALDPTLGYDLFKTDDPLLEGESTIAKNYLVINQVGGIPSGDTIPVNNELHVLIGAVQEPLLSIGINIKTIRVFDKTRTVEYEGPDGAAPDFDIVPGTPTTPVKIVRTSASTIPSGAEVSVDYQHDENFTVTYVINDLLQELQNTIENGKKSQRDARHVTADVIVKQAVDNSIDIETTIQLFQGATKDKADPLVRSNVSRQLDQKLIGQGSAQADIIAAIDDTDGVDFPVVPFARMAYADGSIKLRETVLSSVTRLPALDIGGNEAYILTDALENPTTDGGGLKTEHKGVFQDDVAMHLSDSLLLTAMTTNAAFIIGSAGAVIPGYTDAATLSAAGFTTPAQQAAELLRRTANHVVIALAALDAPSLHKYAVSYVIRGDSGSHDITSSAVEFITLGNFTLTFRAAGGG
jgi:hypothetical protein